VSGIDFLGAGTILFLRHEVIRGLTTAASLWTVAAVGLAVGGGLYVAALATTTIVVIILALMKPIESERLPASHS
jgi:putative Mg2+ transporter-C (MgtC) family protein